MSGLWFWDFLVATVRRKFSILFRTFFTTLWPLLDSQISNIEDRWNPLQTHVGTLRPTARDSGWTNCRRRWQPHKYHHYLYIVKNKYKWAIATQLNLWFTPPSTLFYMGPFLTGYIHIHAIFQKNSSMCWIRIRWNWKYSPRCQYKFRSKNSLWNPKFGSSGEIKNHHHHAQFSNFSILFFQQIFSLVLIEIFL